MESSYKRIGDYIQQVDVRNSDSSVTELIGVSISKTFMKSVANTIGTDLSKYKVISKGQFACSLMQVSRDGGIAISLYKEDIPAIMSPAYFIFEVNGKELLAEYLELVVYNSMFDKEAVFNAIGGVRGTLSWEEFCDMKINIPTLEEQQRIVRQYKTITDRIGVLEKINENLEQQAALLFNQNYFSNKYKIVTLEDVATIKYGKGLPTKELISKGFPVFGGNGIIGWYSSFMYEKPQVLVSCRGAASGNIIETYPNSFVTSNSLVLEWKDYRYYEFYKQFLFANPLYSYATGSAQPQITIDNIKNVPVPFPNYDEICELCSNLRSISTLHYRNIVENNMLRILRDTLLPKLMSGQLDVSVLDL